MKRKIALFCVLLISVLTVSAQTREIKGKVTNEEGMPLSGVSVTVAGNKTGTQTDNDGNFSIWVSGNADLTISYVGYLSRTVKTNIPDNIINVTLERQAASNEEVVVIGYQSVKRRDLVNSVSSITAKYNPQNQKCTFLEKFLKFSC